MSNPNQALIRDIDRTCKLLTGASHELSHLAEAFYRTGNPTMGETLDIIAQDLDNEATTLSRDLGRWGNDSLTEARNQVGNMLKTFLDAGRD